MITNSSKRYVLRTFGCKSNFYDTQQIEVLLQNNGWQPAIDRSEVSLFIINSCTVTAQADHQIIRTIRKLSDNYPDAVIVLTGCMVDVHVDDLQKYKGVHCLISNKEKPMLVKYLNEIFKNNQKKASLPEIIEKSEWQSDNVLFWVPDETVFKFKKQSSRTRQLIKIQEGCRSYCSYCIVPYVRGPKRSFKLEEIIKNINYLVDRGVQEIILTGTKIGAYGSDLDNSNINLEYLIETILHKTKVNRLRLSSLSPSEISPSILNLIKAWYPRLCPHIHVSLQSPISKILKLMNRSYNSQEVENCLNNINSVQIPQGGVFVGMDVMTGFPGESEKDFSLTVKNLESLPWTRLHVFPYSERPQTEASKLPGVVPNQERAKRAKILNELSLKRLYYMHEKLFSELSAESKQLENVLFEGNCRGPDNMRNWIC